MSLQNRRHTANEGLGEARKRALMILGTASHVGKSILAAGLGRVFADEGYRIAPFKAQNMSLNSAVTPDGGEIGRAQALQAEACRAVPTVEMNPILLKPAADIGAQVIVLGKMWAQVTAADYHTRRVEQLFPQVLAAYQRLAARHELIVLEGAGSPAEINLREHDIVNMRMAHAADAACLLVGDIDRGGVFASLLGTLDLLDPEDRARIRGFVINKFRGDEALLEPGIAMIERRLRLPCLGVVPFLGDLGLDEEDAVSLQQPLSAHPWNNPEAGPARALRIGVAALPHMANFTDFDPLMLEPAVSLAYLTRPEQMAIADLLILPGSKQTLDDLRWLDECGFSEELRRLHHRGVPIIGVCGGFQMMGTSIEDPLGIENQGSPVARNGLCLLPVRTVLRQHKTVRRVEGVVRCDWFGVGSQPSIPFEGYEIHLGETFYETGASPYAEVFTSERAQPQADGAVSSSGRSFGTYVHGLFDRDDFRHAFIEAARASVHLAPATKWANVAAQRDARIDRLAAQLKTSLDMELIRSWIIARE
jgi:adenosylcobyric acid synthase